MAIMNEVMAQAATQALGMATDEQWNTILESTKHAEEAFAKFNAVAADKMVTGDEVEEVLTAIFTSMGGITGNAMQAYFASMMKKVFG